METKLLKAWMAGFLDGEGCLTITRQIRKNRPSATYRSQISVTNTVRESLVDFQTTYGGSIYEITERRNDKNNRKWSDSYVWYCPLDSAKLFLEEMLPHLRVKKQQAQILLVFLDTKNSFKRNKRTKGRHGGSACLTQEELNHRESLRNKIQSLNSKGKYAREIDFTK